MTLLKRIILAGLTGPALSAAAHAAELIMVERKGCHYCIEWLTDLGPIYPKTPEGAFAPLRIVDIAQSPPLGVTFDTTVVYTPTFVLVENGTELARIEGYPGEDFFWGLLGMILENNTDFEKSVETN